MRKTHAGWGETRWFSNGTGTSVDYGARKPNTGQKNGFASKLLSANMIQICAPSFYKFASYLRWANLKQIHFFVQWNKFAYASHLSENGDTTRISDFKTTLILSLGCLWASVITCRIFRPDLAAIPTQWPMWRPFCVISQNLAASYLLIDILNSASRILQCWSYYVKINSARHQHDTERT